MSFGILTLATPGDYQKAIGLALSARVSNPGVPLAVAASAKLKSLLAPHFDYFIVENAALRGFEHKVHMDHYSPFEDTFFFDSDVLLFRDLAPIAKAWSQQPYTACGLYLADGLSSFGMDRKKVLKKIGKPSLVVVDGAGHCFFRKPQSNAFFDMARDITARHQEFCGNIKYADEDVVDIVMTAMDLKPAPHAGFFARYLSAKRGSMRMNALQGQCSYTDAVTGETMTPFMVHFAANEAPFPYAKQLHALFVKSGVDTSGLYATAAHDFFEVEIKLRLRRLLRKLLKKANYS
jgi:hypothetical protein